MRCLIVVLLFISLLIYSQQPDKVAAVEKGELKEARVSWWGYDSEDSTEFLIAAINSRVPRLIVDRMQGPWITAKQLNLVSNQEIVFEEGVELLAKKGEFHGLGDCLLCLANVENVILRGLGTGATLRMRKGDYHTGDYKKSEWRHALSILSSRNVKVMNLKMVESGGDGIYFGVRTQGKYPTDIQIIDCVCDGNNRQGISVIAGVNVLIENTKLINTKGTAPEAGIDFEPNKADEPIRNFVMRNCYSENNAGGGYVSYLPNMETPAGPLEIIFERCVSRNDKSNAFSLCTSNAKNKKLQGKVILRDCYFENSEAPIRFMGLSSTGFQTVLENVVVNNIATVDGTASSPFSLSLGANDEEAFGNMVFKNVVVLDDFERPVLRFFNGGAGVGGMDAIEGNIMRIHNGQVKKIVLTSEWARKTYPPRTLCNIAPVDMSLYELQDPSDDGVSRLNAKMAELKVRHAGEYLIQGTKGKTINVSASFLKLGRYEAENAPVTLESPSGKTISLEPIPYARTKEFSVPAEETGLYKLTINAGICLSCINACNCPVAVMLGSKMPDLCMSEGDFYVNVPAGTEQFAFIFRGDAAEMLHAKVFGPDGTLLWEKDNISGAEQFVCAEDPARYGGLFRIRVKKPSDGILEDYFIRIDGIPPFISPSPKHVIDYRMAK